MKSLAVDVRKNVLLSEDDILLAASLAGEEVVGGLTDRLSVARALVRFGAIPANDPSELSKLAWATVRLAADDVSGSRVVQMQLSQTQHSAIAFAVQRWASDRTQLRDYVVCVVAHGARSLARDDRAPWVEQCAPDMQADVRRVHSMYRNFEPRPTRLLHWARSTVERAAESHQRDKDGRSVRFELSVACSAGGYVLPFAMRALALNAGVQEETLLASLCLPPPELFDTIPGDFVAICRSRTRNEP